MSDSGTHIAVWEAAGLIDQATADRLRRRIIRQDQPLSSEAAAAGA